MTPSVFLKVIELKTRLKYKFVFPKSNKLKNHSYIYDVLKH